MIIFLACGAAGGRAHAQQAPQCYFNTVGDYICPETAARPLRPPPNLFQRPAATRPPASAPPVALPHLQLDRQLALSACFNATIADSGGVFDAAECELVRACMSAQGLDPGFICGPAPGLPPPGPACDASSGAGGRQALMSDSAADSAGINTHINYSGTVYDRRYNDIIRPRLLELGVRHIRDNPGGGVFMDRFIELSRSGIKILMVNSNHGHQQYVKQLNARAGAQIVEAVEPPNESDNQSLMGDQGDIAAYVRQMYAVYKSDPATRDITVLGPSFANTRDSASRYFARFPAAGAYMDAGNIHDYSGGQYPEGAMGGGWGVSLDTVLPRHRFGTTKPIWSTEFGFRRYPDERGHRAVSDRAAAKYFPRTFLLHIMRNAPRAYVYQFIENKLGAHDFGILNQDGSPRQQFTAMKNFIAMFNDPGPAFTSGTLDYTLGGNMANVQQMLFQKRDGKFYLVVWQGVSSSNGPADIEPPRRQLTLNLGMNISRAVVYEPTFSLTPVQTYSDAGGISGIPLSVPDHIVVVELTPAQCDPALNP